MFAVALLAAGCGRPEEPEAPVAGGEVVPPVELTGGDLPVAVPEAGDGAGAVAERPGAGGEADSGGAPSENSPATSGGAGAAPAEGAAGLPAAADDVAAVLRRATAAYEGVQSLRADFVMHMRNDLLRQNTTSRGTLYQEGRDRIAVRFTEPAGDLIVGDGQSFYTYYPSVDAQQVLRVPAQGGDVGAVDLRAQFVGNPLERFNATLEGSEAVAGRAAHVVTLVPRQRVDYRSLKVWVDARDGLVRRFEVVEHNGTHRRFDLSGLAVNISIPDATFRFTPPPGVRVVNAG